MAKRITKAETQLIVWAIIIGLPIYGITQLGESMGWSVLIGIFIIAIIIYFVVKSAQTKKQN